MAILQRVYAAVAIESCDKRVEDNTTIVAKFKNCSLGLIYRLNFNKKYVSNGLSSLHN